MIKIARHGDLVPPVSRRGFVGCGVAALLGFAPSNGWAQNAAGASSASQGAQSSGQDNAKVAAATDVDQHLTVGVKINGRGPYRFVVDTGADRTVMADNVAQSLGLVSHDSVVVQGIIRDFATETAFVREVNVGSIAHGNLYLPVVPRTLLKSDGYLGLDIIDGHRVVFDFQNQVLEIDRSRPLYSFPDKKEAKIPVVGSAGHLRAVTAKVDDVATATFIDSGAEATIGNQELLAALIKSGSNIQLNGTVQITGVTGGMVEAQVIKVRNISLKGLYLVDCWFAIADLQIFDTWGLEGEPALLIGMNYLRQFAKVSIDYGEKEIRFDMAANRVFVQNA